MLLLFSVLLLAGLVSFSDPTPDGARLFQRNCANCHRLDSDLPTGPGLRGVETRWKSNWTELARYIRDSQTYMRDKRAFSNYAEKLFHQYEKKVMTRHDLSNEEIVALLKYIQTAPKD